MFSPNCAVKRGVLRVLGLRRGLRRNRCRRQMGRTLVRAKLSPSVHGHCIKRVSNNRYRETGVTETLMLEPRLIVYSRPMSDLSCSVQGRVLRLLGRLRRGCRVACLLVARSLSGIPCLYGRITVVCRKHIIRFVSRASDLGRATMRPCAGSLFSSVPMGRPGVQEVKSRRGGVFSSAVPRRNYPCRGQYEEYAGVYERRVPRLARVRAKRFTTYRVLWGVGRAGREGG